jgi:hypothetical protein
MEEEYIVNPVSEPGAGVSPVWKIDGKALPFCAMQ